MNKIPHLLQNTFTTHVCKCAYKNNCNTSEGYALLISSAEICAKKPEALVHCL